MLSVHLDSHTMYEGLKLLLNTRNNVFFRIGSISNYVVKMKGKWVYLEILKQFSELVQFDDIDAIQQWACCSKIPYPGKYANPNINISIWVTNNGVKQVLLTIHVPSSIFLPLVKDQCCHQAVAYTDSSEKRRKGMN